MVSDALGTSDVHLTPSFTSTQKSLASSWLMRAPVEPVHIENLWCSCRIGRFATRSPHMPNAVGSSVVKLIEKGKRTLSG